jgi:hypothetical protein
LSKSGAFAGPGGGDKMPVMALDDDGGGKDGKWIRIKSTMDL